MSAKLMDRLQTLFNDLVGADPVRRPLAGNAARPWEIAPGYFERPAAWRRQCRVGRGGGTRPAA